MPIRPFDAKTAYHAVKDPARVSVVICRDAAGKPNAITVEWFTRTSIQPLMLAISIGLTRYSHPCLQNDRYFNLVLPSSELRDWTLLCGSRSGRDTDKLAGIDTIPGRLTRLPVPKKAAAVFECEIVTQILTGDHTLFVGEVRHAWINEGIVPLLSEQLFA